MRLIAPMVWLPYANATHEADACSAQLGDLSAAIEEAVYTNDKDEDRLLDRVDASALKLFRHKFGDAEDKLVSIGLKVLALRDARKPKISDDTEIQNILDAVDDALRCVPGGLDSLP